MNGELTQTTIWAVIAGMAAANFILRFTPIAVLSRVELHPILLRWLSFVPISVMGALVASEVLRPGNAWQPPLMNPGLYAAVLTALVYRFSRSFLGATLTGMVAFVLLRALMS